MESQERGPVTRQELKAFLVPKAYLFLRKADKLPRKMRRQLARESAKRLSIKIRAGEEI